MKKKSKILIGIAACVVVIAVILVCLLTGKKDFRLPDYTSIPIDESVVEVTDEEIQNSIDATLEMEAETLTLDEGTVQDGDVLDLTYVGVLEGETEPFEGGSSDHAVLKIGSGTMIDGFEDGIIGHEVGELFHLSLTFPEDYGDFGGQDVDFAIQVNNIQRYQEPELTDEFAKEYAEKYMLGDVDTVEEFKELTQDSLYTSRLHDAILNYFLDNTTVTSYDKATLEKCKAYATESASYYIQEMGENVTFDDYNSVEEYINETAKKYTKQIMIVDKLFSELKLVEDDTEFDESLAKYMVAYDYDYTVDEFKEKSSENWLFIYHELGYKFDKVTETLENNVSFIENDPS